MSRSRSVTPDPDAYSRVSNPERFQPLIEFVIDRFGELHRTFDVAQSEAFAMGSADELQPFVASRSPITLTPRSTASAPLAVAFTIFPGVLMRCGYWRIEAFPQCGCDACQETAEDEIVQFSRVVDAVVGGRFHEVGSRPLFGRPEVRHVFYDADNAGWFGGTRYPSRAQARELFRGLPLVTHWSAWPERA